MNNKDLMAYLSLNFPNLISSLTIQENNDILITLFHDKDLLLFFRFLKKHALCQFSQLLDLWALDFLLMTRRFQVNYLVLSLS
jgi:NADH:ubiquinone oxidoreductase subunit C